MKTNKKTYLAALSALLILGACSDLMVPNYNAASQEDLAANPTPAAVAAVAQGLLAGQRGLTSAYVIETGGWGREVYNLRPEEPRTITQVLITPLDGEANFWSANYRQIKNIKVLLDAVEAAEGLTDAEKEAARGFAYTLWAETLFHVNLMHGELGAPIDVLDDPNELAELRTESEVYAEVFRLYDEGAAALQNGGGSFPFQMTPGLANFDTPAKFLEVNRALKVRALKYTDQWTEVLSTLPQTFMDETASLTYGAYHSYSSRSGDSENGLCCTVAYYAHPRIRADAQLQADGSLDQRALDKTYTVPAFKLLGIVVTERFGNWEGFSSLEDPRSWIRNEELILIRAEANHALDNDVEALADVNLIRTTSGNLTAIDAATWNSWTDEERLTEILYNKFMSLVLEGGFTYLDHRQYDRLGPQWLPRAKDADTGEDLGHVVFPRYPYPTNECLARNMTDELACQIVYGS